MADLTPATSGVTYIENITGPQAQTINEMVGQQGQKVGSLLRRVTFRATMGTSQSKNETVMSIQDPCISTTSRLVSIEPYNAGAVAAMNAAVAASTPFPIQPVFTAGKLAFTINNALGQGGGIFNATQWDITIEPRNAVPINDQTYEPA
jgi:hypothetical protein